MHARLRDDGFDVGPPREFHGAWTFFFRAPGGFDIEVLHQYRRGDDVGGVRSTPVPSGSARSDIS
jgi:hypothetical protein